jgi:cytochrome c oxidase assembly protein subunit 15
MQPRLVSRWALAATIALVTLGGFTRGSGSGYGCEDRWPLCEGGLLGGLLPRADFNMIVEWSHRWLAAIVGLLAILTAIAAWRHAGRWVAWVSVAAVGVIGIQAWVGRLVVTNNLDADLVSLHLGISMTVALQLTVVAVATSAIEASHDRSWAIRLSAGAVVTGSVLLLGSFVHNVYVPGWPLTLDDWIPDLGSRTIALHFLHRVTAATALVIAGLLSWQVERLSRPGFERIAVHVASGAVAVNVGLGAAHVFTQVTWSWLVAAHLGIASTALVAYVAAAVSAAGASNVVRPSESAPVLRNKPAG